MKMQVDLSLPFACLPPAFFFGKASNGFKTCMRSFILVFFCSVLDVKNAELFFCLPATLIGYSEGIPYAP